MLLDTELKNIDNPNNISDTLINIGGRIGKLMDVTHQSMDPKSQDWENISNVEKEKIYKAIKEVEEKMARLKLSVKWFKSHLIFHKFLVIKKLHSNLK